MEQVKQEVESLSESEAALIEALRRRGYAVTVFTPHELRDADPDSVQERMVQVGWDIIDNLASYQRDEVGK